MASDAQRIRDAAARYGPSLNAIAARYTNPVTGQRLSGEALILKTVQGESAGRRDAVSSAGAKGWAQFMPGTRAAVIRQFGVDPWRSPEEAVHALALHMRGKLGNATGLEGYNPGGGRGYVNYILGQRVGGTRGSGAAAGSPGVGGSGPAGSPSSSSSSGFSPGGLSARLASVQIERPPQISSMGVSIPSQLRPKFYMDVPSSGPPIPPADPALPDATGQNVSFGGGGSAASASSAPAGASSAASVPQVKGIAHFAGKPVAGWIAPILAYARAHGWKGQVNSGFRSFADQQRIYNSGVRPAAKPGTSNHEGADFPRGAVDVSDAAQLSAILKRSPYAKTLVWAGAKDPVHFSHPHNGSY